MTEQENDSLTESGDELETICIEAQARVRTWIERITEWVAKLLARP